MSRSKTAIKIRERLQLERTMRDEADRNYGRYESYRRALQSGNTAETFHVIDAADNDKLANRAVLHHIAELIDLGREEELTTQLRAYAVKYLVHPIDIMRRRDG